MVNITLENVQKGLTKTEIHKALDEAVDANADKKKILLIPPDNTRSQSGAGDITAYLYRAFKKRGAKVKIMPALGTHMKMTESELKSFFGEDIPISAYIHHNYKEDTIKIGTVPAKFVKEVSEGLIRKKIDVEVNKILTDGTFDLIFSIGQVVPHEIAGMANYSKNIFVGCGGEEIIGATHMMGALYGMERTMGSDHSPVRKVFDYAQEHFAKNMPIIYILTVCMAENRKVKVHGLYAGRERALFESAVSLSQKLNITYVDHPPKKIVVYLSPKKFKTTWLGNKAIYRTRMAVADGGEIVVIAPSVRQCGENEEADKLIRKFGYVGRAQLLKMYGGNDELKANPSVAAHLIHGSSEGRFKITYCPGRMSREEIVGLGYSYMDIKEAREKYKVKTLKDGWNKVGGEEIFFVSNPAMGLWVDEKRLK